MKDGAIEEGLVSSRTDATDETTMQPSETVKRSKRQTEVTMLCRTVGMSVAGTRLKRWALRRGRDTKRRRAT